MKKAIIIVLILSACLGLVGRQVYLKVLRKQDPGGRRGARAVAVEVKPVTRQTMRDVREFTGTLLPKARFAAAPKVPGRLEKLLVNIGDQVKNGDLIAVLDSQEYAQQVAQANAELEVSRANLADSRSALDVAEREHQRAKELRQQEVASEAELDQAEAHYRAAKAKYEVAEAQIKQKEAALKAAEVRLSYTRIEASWDDGQQARIVAERFVDEGAMLRANDPIVSIVDLSEVLAIINVIERDFPQVRVGQAATVSTDAYPDMQFAGTVARRAPVMKEESRQARVEIAIPNPEGLLAAGMFARARLQFAEHPDAIVVPTAALVRRNGRQGVFLADASQMKARFVPVEVGIAQADGVEIVKPQIEGMVVTLGQHLLEVLEDGASIALPQAGPAGRARGTSAPAAKADRPQEGRP